jgi:hypothetical protein
MRAFVVAVRPCAGQELVNELEALVRSQLDHGLEVAAIVGDVAGGFVVVFRPRVYPGPSHVTARIVDSGGYPR